MTIIGIDLGTTNSACAIWQDSKPTLIANRLGKTLTPSVVGVDDNGELLVGETAKHRLISHPKLTASVFKRYMGSRQEFKLGRRSYSAIELSALVLKSLKEDAEHFLGHEVTQAVISVPAYFNDIQRKATKQAAELAGLTVERLINEPTAAAMVYGLHESDDSTQFIVLDMGGGTFDVTLIEFFSGVMEVHASSGDNFLGGEDFTQAIIQQFLDDQQMKYSDLSTAEQQHLHSVVDNAKHSLTTNQQVVIEHAIKQQKAPWVLERTLFEKIVTPLLKRIQDPVEKTLRDSNTNPYDIDQIVLVGGATRMQVLRSLTSKMFRRMPSGNIDPDLVVAMGTAIQAGLREKNSDFDDVVLTDVCPYTLGTGIVNENDTTGNQGSIFFPIIERNTIIPVSIEKPLCTVRDNQTQLLIDIYQGESRLVKNNIYLGEIEVNVPKAKAGKETVEVRYSYDMNGLLEVDVTVSSTGKKYHKQIINSPGELTDQEISASSQKLSKLKFHPREHEGNRNLIARAERIYESSLEERRHYVSALLADFEAALEKQDTKLIAKAAEEMESRLNELEKDDLFT